MDDARAAEAAGAFGILIECVPYSLAAQVTAAVSVPTIGIGAGPSCDGQVLVINDLLGLTVGHVPKFVRTQANLADQIDRAVQSYASAVRDGSFPDLSESFQ
jgi:3-methyl-2-oxobutanoate hydroxymethyltransferase